MPYTAYDLTKIRRFLGYPASVQSNAVIQSRLNDVQALGEAEVLATQTHLRRLEAIEKELPTGNRAALIAESRGLINQVSVQLSLVIMSDIYAPTVGRLIRG